MVENNAPEHAKMDVVTEPQPDVASSDQVDCLSQMIMLGQQEKLPEMDTINEKLATLEERMGKSVRDHLGFGLVSASAIKVVDNLIGEFDEDNNLNGRGIFIHSDGTIVIGYFQDDVYVPGNFTRIYSWGEIRVGEIYLKDGEECCRETRYYEDGTTEEVDN